MSIKSGEIAKVPVKINVVLVEVKINVVLVEDRTPVLFEPRLEHAFENITICSNIIFLKEGVSSRTTHNNNKQWMQRHKTTRAYDYWGIKLSEECDAGRHRTKATSHTNN